MAEANAIWAEPKPGPGATQHYLGRFKVSALIRGDGVDLCVEVGDRYRTLQLSCDEARALAAALVQSADESPGL